MLGPQPTPCQGPESPDSGVQRKGWLSDPARTCMFRGLSGPHLHQPAATQEAAGHVADHGANGPEVVLAAGAAPSRRWAQQWYGLVVGVAWRIPALSPPGWLSILRPSYTLEVFAARRSAQTPRGVPSVTGDAATHKSALSREYRDGHDTTSKRGGKGDSPSSGAAGLHHTARFASVARTRQLRGSSGNHRRRQAIHSCPCM